MKKENLTANLLSDVVFPVSEMERLQLIRREKKQKIELFVGELRGVKKVMDRTAFLLTLTDDPAIHIELSACMVNLAIERDNILEALEGMRNG